jgi:hypothetical protein
MGEDLAGCCVELVGDADLADSSASSEAIF